MHKSKQQAQTSYGNYFSSMKMRSEKLHLVKQGLNMTLLVQIKSPDDEITTKEYQKTFEGRIRPVRCSWSSYSVFQEFRQAKSANGASILSLSQFLILPKLPQKMKLPSNMVTVESKIIISLPKI